MGGGRGERARQGLVVAQVGADDGAARRGGAAGAELHAGDGRRPRLQHGQRARPRSRCGRSPREPQVRQRRVDSERRLLAELGALPGVERVGLVSAFPLWQRLLPQRPLPRDDAARRDREPGRLRRRSSATRPASCRADAGYRVASEGYFAAMGIPLIRGRLFEVSDGPDAPHVALISESLAKAQWPDAGPDRRFVQFGNMDGDLRGFRIVGIVGDVREISPETRALDRFLRLLPAAADLPRQHGRQELDPIGADGGGPPDRPHGRSGGPLQIRTVEDAFDRALAGRRFSLLLDRRLQRVRARAGHARRLRADGVSRLAAHARSASDWPSAPNRPTSSRSSSAAECGLAVIGVAIGSVAALGLTRLLDGMLFGVTATDPIAFASVIAPYVDSRLRRHVGSSHAGAQGCTGGGVAG